MLRRYLIIDGYNLLHACGLARRRYGPGQLERCRAQLLGYLARHLAGHERERTTVVFDAGGAPSDLPRHGTALGMEIWFAPPGKEADDTIEELIAAHSAPRQIRLVSSDHRLQRSVRRRRGTFVDSEDFVSELERRGPRAEPAPNAPAVPRNAASEKTLADSGLEAENWLAIFGDISESAELTSEEDRAESLLGQAEIAAMQAEIDRQAAADPSLARRPASKGGRQEPRTP